MNDQHPDGFTMIGLHKLAAQSGDGLVPELYELLQQHTARQQIYQNVTLFPTWEARMPGEAATRPLGAAAANGNNILAFPSPAVRAGKRKA
ncbi:MULTISPECIES: hypothetical protein [unclassified Rhizobium]|jgi:hypothetical protein|uniref:hypothetical protein n=1 Tax=unclassified Rhizobium TaxID=2613769 RepID=UPI0007E9A541|nr:MULTISPECIES: hypothetical protein [unclassified Rhizobium]ANK86900.1 hypothetical protein AMK02_CH03353 [Rhizobium sp. N731]ANL17146.1 hypothetical protein AMJ97_CH03351 [Rhizobium sp. N1314]ARO25331.1 hypothetical protein TAL182_CH03602 [Rhizobium sp. TAL182]PDS98018.1 hypothetical protein CO659_08645 [Rhizobium sp. S9]